MAIMSGLFLILSFTGVFSAERNKYRVFLQNELGHAAQEAVRDYDALSVAGVSLGERLTEQIEKTLGDHGLSPADLKNNPQYLEPVLSQTVGLMCSALEKSKSSGIFLTLDATINPALINAECSRAGLFLKNMEPNVINVTFPTIRLLKGPVTIARQEGLDLLPQWQMEFTVQQGDFFFTTIDAAQNAGRNLPLSRLYYWNPGCLLPGCYDKAMLLCAPLIASDGTVMGVCGYEISAMLFKLQYTPDDSPYKRAVTMLAPFVDNTLDVSRALFAGHFTDAPARDDGFLSIKDPVNGIVSYIASDGTSYSGLHQSINLYPKGSAFFDQQWAIAVLNPSRDLSAKFTQQNRLIQILLITLFIIGIGMAALLSRRHAAPMVDALHKAQADAFLGRAQEIAQISSLVQSFTENLKTLTPAERSVFDLYLQECTAREIAEKLCLSINTIKTHTKHIYDKMNVSSRKELLLYVKMIQEQESSKVE